MSLPHHLARALAVVTLLVAACLFAPSLAQAHGGHSHHAEMVVAAQIVVAPETANTEAGPAAGVALASLNERPSFASTPSLPGAKQVCPGGCCHSGGMSCCAAFIAAEVDFAAPVLHRPSLEWVAVKGAGIIPGALPEPPKSLV